MHNLKWYSLLNVFFSVFQPSAPYFIYIRPVFASAAIYIYILRKLRKKKRTGLYFFGLFQSKKNETGIYTRNSVYVEIDRYIDDNVHVKLKRVEREKATHIHKNAHWIWNLLMEREKKIVYARSVLQDIYVPSYL